MNPIEGGSKAPLEMIYSLLAAIDDNSGNPTPETQQRFEIALKKIKIAEFKVDLESGVFSNAPVTLTRAALAAWDAYLEAPSDEDEAVAENLWLLLNKISIEQTTNQATTSLKNDLPKRIEEVWESNGNIRSSAQLSAADTLSNDNWQETGLSRLNLRLRNITSAAAFGFFFVSSQVAGISIISPKRVLPIGTLAIGARGALLVVMSMFFVLTLIFTQRSNENNFLKIGNDTIKGMGASWRNRLVFLLLGATTFFQIIFVVPTVFHMLGGIVLTPSIMLPAFAIVPLSALMIGLAFVGGIFRGGKYSFKNVFFIQCSSSSLLLIIGITILMAGSLRWLAFSFINSASYPVAVSSKLLNDLPPGVVDTALVAHAMIFATLLLFVTCVVIYLEYVSRKAFSRFAIILTIFCAIYSGLFVFEYHTLFLPDPTSHLDLLENATYIAGRFNSSNPLAYYAMMLSLYLDIGGLVYIAYVGLKAVWNTPQSRLNVYRLAVAFVILLSEVLEIIALLNLYRETTLSVPLNFPYLEITLTAGIVLIALELTLGQAARTDVSRS